MFGPLRAPRILFIDALFRLCRLKQRFFGPKLPLGANRCARYRSGMKSLREMSIVPPLVRLQARVIGMGAILAVLAGAALTADTFVARMLNVDHLPGDLRRFLGLSEIFAHGAGVVLASWCVWHLSPGVRRCLPRLFACALLPGLAANMLKLSVCRLRPAFFNEQMPSSILDTWIGGLPAVFSTRADYGTYFASSFPSGHASTAFGLAFGLSWLFPAGRWPFFTFAGLATLQRITSGAHWLSDTLVGVALAVVIAGSLTSSTRVARLFARFEAGGSSVRIINETRRAA